MIFREVTVSTRTEAVERFRRAVLSCGVTVLGYKQLSADELAYDVAFDDEHDISRFVTEAWPISAIDLEEV